MKAVQSTWQATSHAEMHCPAKAELSRRGSELAATSTPVWIHERLDRARLTNIERLIALESYRRGDALGQLLLSVSARLSLLDKSIRQKT
jgi:hypothetical protein